MILPTTDLRLHNFDSAYQTFDAESSGSADSGVGATSRWVSTVQTQLIAPPTCSATALQTVTARTMLQVKCVEGRRGRRRDESEVWKET